MELNGKVALVTGAARRVGRAIALALASRGAILAVHYRNSAAQAAETIATIEAAGGVARAFHADLEKISDIQAMVNSVAAAFGRLDILVNSASVFYRKPLEELSERDWDMNLDTNLKAPFFAAKFAGAIMRRQGAGKIVNIGDSAGIRPYNNYLPYTVSKSALIGLTQALAKALAPQVQVNCLAIGPVLRPEDYSAEQIEGLARSTLTKRLGTPQDVARAVLFLCETDFATGATLVLDGGRLIA
ncbi:MAG TPA: SDR family oxidoreductase [Candidatus Binataceae bacterium]|jgi:pteridine reductase|nr:SDR family oxidoreductase [Candidatus Binataceae bacterium]